MSPSIRPPAPGTRWRVTIAKIDPDGTTVDDWVDFEGDAYVVAVANRTATRLTTDMDHDGDIALRQRLIAHLAIHIDASQR